MTKLYRVREEATCTKDGFSVIRKINLNRVTNDGYLWVHVRDRTYRSVATGQLARWFNYEVEPVD